MKRRSPPRARPQRGAAGGERPAPAEAPDQPGIEQAQPRGPTEDSRSAQSGIESVDERRAGSIETVPAAQDQIAGFVEPCGDERADEALPPPLPAQ